MSENKIPAEAGSRVTFVNRLRQHLAGRKLLIISDCLQAQGARLCREARQRAGKTETGRLWSYVRLPPPSSRFSRGLFAVFAAATVLLLALIAGDGVRRGQDMAFPSLHRNIWSLGVAISELDYGTRGMVGLKDVDDALIKGGFNVEGDPERLKYVLTHSDAADKVIQDAAHLPHVDRARTFIVYANETGSIDFYELAFWLFGHHIVAFYWLWFTMVTLIAGCFLLSFRKCPVLIFPSLIFLTVLFAYVNGLDVSSLGLATPTNARCLPVTALYPILYILTLAAAAHRFRWSDLATSVLCGLMYAFIVNARTAALWQLGGPAGTIVLALVVRFFPRLQAIWGAERLAKYALWPLAVFCIVTVAWMGVHQARQNATAYSAATVFGHEYWPAILQAVMPFYRDEFAELESRAGMHIGNNPDSFIAALSLLKIAERGEKIDDYLIDGLDGRYWNVKEWDKLCREIVFDIWRDHPDRMINGYFEAFHLSNFNLRSFLFDDLLILLLLPAIFIHWLLRRNGTASLASLLPGLVVLAPLGDVATLLMPVVGPDTKDYFLPSIILLMVAASVPWRRRSAPAEL